MKKRSNGFAHLGILLLLVALVAIALVGYKVAKNSSDNSKLSNSTASVTTQPVQTIKSTADLNSAETTLNSQNIDGDLNPDSLNQDVQSLL